MAPGTDLWVVAITVLLAVFLVVTAVAQIRHPAVMSLRRFDFFGLLPAWWFFAPDPAKGDYSLVLRQQHGERQVTDWVELRVVSKRRWWACVWNPWRRQSKTFFDIATDLMDHSRVVSPVQIQASVPYLLLLCFVSDLPHITGATALQFALTLADDSGADSEPQLIFVSAWHGLAV